MRCEVIGSCALYLGDCVEVLPEIRGAHACVTDPPYFLDSIQKRFGAKNAAPAKSNGATGVYARQSANFMGCEWDDPGDPEIDPGFAHWLAGFVDGEGCFSVHKKQVSGCETFDCQFSISLRDDDEPIVREIQKNLGGRGAIARREVYTDVKNAKPQVRYCISSKADCLYLRELFRVFPLRAKKARDFEIWSAALDEWLAHEPGSGWEGMAYLRNRLMAVKRYGSRHNRELIYNYVWARAVHGALVPGGHIVSFAARKKYHHLACAIEDAGFEPRNMLTWMYATGKPNSHNVGKMARKAGASEEVAAPWDGYGTDMKAAFEPLFLARKSLGEPTVAANMIKHEAGALNIEASRGPDGRWPATVIHDGSVEVYASLPPGAREMLGCFPVAKPTRKERELGLGSEEGNRHPTVKPVALLAHLARLVCPPGGLVLDPFMGSGSTGIACVYEGFRFIGIEKDEAYFDIARRRIEAAVKEVEAGLFSPEEMTS